MGVLGPVVAYAEDGRAVDVDNMVGAVSIGGLVLI